ncbi:MAG: APC family permease, partial [Bacillota bacterium]
MGGTIGADLYVASAFGADLGSSGLFVWGAGAVMAMAVAMAFATCALVVPGNGGPYLYARRAFGPLAGFMAGWAVLVAQWSSLVALPIAFSRYLQSMIAAAAAWPPWWTSPVRAGFLLLVALAIYQGPRLASLITDLLTVARLLPLLVVVAGGLAWAALHPGRALANLLPLQLPPWDAAGALLVPVFWAYAGFEVGSIPAGQVRNPHRTIPLALILGTAACAALYLLANLTTLLVLSRTELAGNTAPLVSCARGVAAGLLPRWKPAAAVAELVLGTGVLVSTLGTAAAITFAATHLLVAMAATGLLPPALGRLHPRRGTPDAALATLVAPAVAASALATISSVVGTAVICSAFAYLATALAAWRLSTSRPGKAAAAGAVVVCLFVFCLTDPAVLAAGVCLLGLGGLVYLTRRRLPAPSPDLWVEAFTALAAPAPPS